MEELKYEKDTTIPPLAVLLLATSCANPECPPCEYGSQTSDTSHESSKPTYSTSLIWFLDFSLPEEGNLTFRLTYNGDYNEDRTSFDDSYLGKSVALDSDTGISSYNHFFERAYVDGLFLGPCDCISFDMITLHVYLNGNEILFLEFYEERDGQREILFWDNHDRSVQLHYYIDAGDATYSLLRAHFFDNFEAN